MGPKQTVQILTAIIQQYDRGLEYDALAEAIDAVVWKAKREKADRLPNKEKKVQ